MSGLRWAALGLIVIFYWWSAGVVAGALTMILHGSEFAQGVAFTLALTLLPLGLLRLTDWLSRS